MNVIIKSKGWDVAAKELVDGGYEMVRRSDPRVPVEWAREDSRSVLPFVFIKEGTPPLYLFRPVGNEQSRLYRRSTRWFATSEIVDGEQRIVLEYVPSADFDPEQGIVRGTLKEKWVPRTLHTLPRELFTVVDAAEHLGYSVSMIKTAVYHRRTLKPDRRLTGAAIVLFTEETLIEWVEAHDREKFTQVRDFPLAIASRAQLVKEVRAAIESGELTSEQILAEVAVMGDDVLAQIADATWEGRLGDELNKLPRAVLEALATGRAAVGSEVAVAG